MVHMFDEVISLWEWHAHLTHTRIVHNDIDDRIYSKEQPWQQQPTHEYAAHPCMRDRTHTPQTEHLPSHTASRMHFHTECRFGLERLGVFRDGRGGGRGGGKRWERLSLNPHPLLKCRAVSLRGAQTCIVVLGGALELHPTVTLGRLFARNTQTIVSQNGHREGRRDRKWTYVSAMRLGPGCSHR